MSLKKRTAETGQVALIVVLMMVIIGTISLSVVSRSITNVSLTTQEESKIRSFSAAEAGIEDLLKTVGGLANVGLAPGSGTLGSGANQITYNYKVDELGSGNAGYELSEPLANGDSMQINLEGGTVTNLCISWGGESGTTKASLEVSIFGASNVTRLALNENATSKTNGFTTANSGGCSGLTKTIYHSQYPLSGLSGKRFIRIKALYNATYLGIKPTSGSLPAQAYKAKVTSQKDESTAGVEVVQSKEAAPGIFDYVLWSGAGAGH